ncbi:unnamed protein product, partial [Ectocarpus sp. 8 AP-2014]
QDVNVIAWKALCTCTPIFSRRPTRPQAPIPIDFTDGQHYGYSRACPLQRGVGSLTTATDELNLTLPTYQTLLRVSTATPHNAARRSCSRSSQARETIDSLAKWRENTH